MRSLCSVALLVAAAGSANAGLSLSHSDNTGGNTLGTFVYANGGGSGFGGTVGAGSISMDSDATNLYVRFAPGGAVNDLVTILLDTRAGGFADSGMNDNSDGGRRASSQQSINANDAYDADFLPDFSLIIASWGSVLFELTGDPLPLNFMSFDGAGTYPRDYTISLAALGSGLGQNVDFLVAYVGDSGYGSNESIPAYEPLNSGNNPGFDQTSAGYGNYNRFVTAVPAPGACAVLGLGAMLAARRKRGS